MTIRDRTKISILILSASVFLISCGEEKTPSRDHIPLIKERIGRLQQALLDKNQAAIDSLLSVSVLKYEQSSDSLLKFIFGAEGGFGFNSFGEVVIVYTDEYAKVECFVTDSTGLKDRPILFDFKYEHDQWLLSRFSIDTTVRDSI